jgi:hypothetical protein
MGSIFLGVAKDSKSLQTIKKGLRSISQLILPIQTNAMRHKTFLPILDNHTKNIISPPTY